MNATDRTMFDHMVSTAVATYRAGFDKRQTAFWWDCLSAFDLREIKHAFVAYGQHNARPPTPNAIGVIIRAEHDRTRQEGNQTHTKETHWRRSDLLVAASMLNLMGIEKVVKAYDKSLAATLESIAGEHNPGDPVASVRQFLSHPGNQSWTLKLDR